MDKEIKFVTQQELDWWIGELKNQAAKAHAECLKIIGATPGIIGATSGTTCHCIIDVPILTHDVGECEIVGGFLQPKTKGGIGDAE